MSGSRVITFCAILPSRYFLKYVKLWRRFLLKIFGKILVSIVVLVSCGAVSVKAEDEIRWMEFNVPIDILKQAMEHDIKSHGSETEIYWVDLLAYAASKHWGEFPKNGKSEHIEHAVSEIEKGKVFSELSDGLKMYPYYKKAYNAVLASMLGSYEV